MQWNGSRERERRFSHSIGWWHGLARVLFERSSENTTEVLKNLGVLQTIDDFRGFELENTIMVVTRSRDSIYLYGDNEKDVRQALHRLKLRWSDLEC